MNIYRPRLHFQLFVLAFLFPIAPLFSWGQSSSLEIQDAEFQITPMGNSGIPPDVVVGSQGILVVDSTFSVEQLTVLGGGLVTHSVGSGSFELTVAQMMTVAAGGAVDAKERGFGTGSGPGAGGNLNGTGSTGGAGHGGMGGASASGAGGGTSYGNSSVPDTLGSGGGVDGSIQGGPGGGKLRISVGQTLTVNGAVISRGSGGKTMGGGGGSGGSIWLTTNSLTGNGLISVAGGCGEGGGGGGAGGHLKIEGLTAGFTGEVSAAGGGSGCGIPGLSPVIPGADGNPGSIEGSVIPTPPAIPGQPVGMPNPTATGFILSWVPSTDDTGLAGYSVRASTDGGVTFTAAGEPATPSISYGSPAQGIYIFKVRAIDAAGNLSGFSENSTPVIVDKTAPTVPGTPAIFPNPNVGTFYVSWTAATDSGGSGILFYTLERSNDGGASYTVVTQTTALSIVESGLAPGTYLYHVKATDGVGNTGVSSAASALVAVLAPPAILTTSLPVANANVPYSVTLSASGGQPPYVWTVVSGALPPGMTLSPGGILLGTPLVNGLYNFTVGVSDSLNPSAGATQVLTLNVASSTPLGGLSISGSPGAQIPPAQVSVPYAFGFTVSGGLGPYAISITGGSVPPGLTLSNSGVLSGVPTAPGIYTFIVSVIDGTGAISSTTATILVGPATPDGVVGVPYTYGVPIAGGTNFTVTTGQLPPGLSINGMTGVISGTPQASGTYVAVVTANTPGGGISSQIVVIEVGTGQPIVQPGVTLLPTGSVGTPYSGGLVGLPLGMTYALTSGAVPPGLAIPSTIPAVSGTPTLAGTYGFIATTSLGGVPVVSGLYSLPITGNGFGTAFLGIPYSSSVASGAPQGTFLITGGTLPPGLFLAPTTGVISGVPQQLGEFLAIVTYTSGNTISSILVSISVLPPTLVTQSQGSHACHRRHLKRHFCFHTTVGREGSGSGMGGICVMLSFFAAMALGTYSMRHRFHSAIFLGATVRK